MAPKDVYPVWLSKEDCEKIIALNFVTEGDLDDVVKGIYSAQSTKQTKGSIE